MVNVRIPRFRIKTEARVTEALQRLGVTDIFDPAKSDLHLLAPNSNLHLSSVAHKSVHDYYGVIRSFRANLNLRIAICQSIREGRLSETASISQLS